LPVVIHGTVGCDLAAQASSLAQLLIDPYFRTYEGFQKLIEKEWIKNGHPFSSRCGHYGTKGRAAAPQAPVFAMWLDAVWQCTRQYPWEFEFNEAFLLVLAKHSFGSQYGTFLFDNEQERAKAGASIKTASLWSMVNIPDERKRLSNPVYQPSEQGWIRPSFKPESIQIWFAFFGKGTPYLDFHEEVGELMVFLKDRQNMLGEEVDRSQAELDALEAELAAETAELEKELAAVETAAAAE